MKVLPFALRHLAGPELDPAQIAKPPIGKGRVAPTSTHAATPAEKRAAQEFEAIFLRKMLACMDKSTKVGGAGSEPGSADGYSSMVVGALADAVAAAGGIGLGQSILHSVEARAHAQGPPSEPPETSGSSSSIQGSAPDTVQGLRKGDE